MNELILKLIQSFLTGSGIAVPEGSAPARENHWSSDQIGRLFCSRFFIGFDFFTLMILPFKAFINKTREGPVVPRYSASSRLSIAWSASDSSKNSTKAKPLGFSIGG